MSINIAVIDSRVRKLAGDLATELETRLNIKNDEPKKQSAAFVYLVAETLLDLSAPEALDVLTEGGADFGIDAMHVGDVEDGEFLVTLLQGKYKQNQEGTSAFPQGGVEKMVQAIKYLFDPRAKITTNAQLTRRVEDVRSLVGDGYIPRVRAVLCNNGIKWDIRSQEVINAAKFPPEQVTWQYVNHDELVLLRQSTKQVDDTLRLAGKAIVEDLDFYRVLIGKIPVSEIAALFARHGDLLLERNVRRFLGLQSNRVNQRIASTLTTPAERGNFYFYNNGITLLCRKFTHNALQADNFQVRVEGLQVINGGQTCKTIEHTMATLAASEPGIEKAFVLVRLYQLPSDVGDLVHSITYATNSQNPVDLRDLRSNDIRQRNLEAAIKDLGYQYHRHRSDTAFKPTDISSATAAEAVLSVWRHRPQQGKFQGREHFDKLYDMIFRDDLNGAQVVLATLLFRIAENKRRRPPAGAPDFVAYGSCFLAMLMGQYLLSDLGLALAQFDHLKFADAKAKLEQNEEVYFKKATDAVDAALKKLYGGQVVSLQRLAGTFRRGDLIQELGVTP
ncbi:MAG: AIPR family protein [Planctomycetes bacterium]|nr:AIPR family protein [Planctomycetota bacterium]